MTVADLMVLLQQEPPAARVTVEGMYDPEAFLDVERPGGWHTLMRDGD